MTWFMIDDGVYDLPRFDSLPPGAWGLWAKAGSYVGRQLRQSDYDGTLPISRVKALGGTPRTVRQLVEAGLWEERSSGVYAFVETAADGTVYCKFAGGADLSEKRRRAGEKGGKASGRSRRSKHEATDEALASPLASLPNEANREANREALASANGEANAKQPDTYTDTHTDTTSPSPSAGLRIPDTLHEAERQVDSQTLLAVRGAWPGRTGRRTDIEPALAQALTECDAKTLYGAVIAYGRAVDTGNVLRRDVPTLVEWLTDGQWKRWRADKPRTYEWGGISREWIKTNIEDHVPAGLFTSSRESTFWAEVKTGTNPADAARSIVDEINQQTRRTTSPAVS